MAVRAPLGLAGRPSGGPTLVGAMAGATKLGSPYLSKPIQASLVCAVVFLGEQFEKRFKAIPLATLLGELSEMQPDQASARNLAASVRDSSSQVAL